MHFLCFRGPDSGPRKRSKHGACQVAKAFEPSLQRVKSAYSSSLLTPLRLQRVKSADSSSLLTPLRLQGVKSADTSALLTLWGLHLWYSEGLRDPAGSMFDAFSGSAFGTSQTQKMHTVQHFCNIWGFRKHQNCIQYSTFCTFWVLPAALKTPKVHTVQHFWCF